MTDELRFEINERGTQGGKDIGRAEKGRLNGCERDL